MAVKSNRILKISELKNKNSVIFVSSREDYEYVLSILIRNFNSFMISGYSRLLKCDKKSLKYIGFSIYDDGDFTDGICSQEKNYYKYKLKRS